MVQPITGRSNSHIVLGIAAAVGSFIAARLLFPDWYRGSTALFVLRELTLMALVLLTLAYVVWVELVPPGHLGLRRPRLSTPVWALATTVAAMVASVVAVRLLAQLGISNDGHAAIILATHPLALIMLAAATAALAEEIAFRAILITHLTALTRSRSAGAAIALVLFAAFHISKGPWTQALPILAPGLVLTLIFMWKRDLTSCVIAHFLTDLAGLLLLHAQAG